MSSSPRITSSAFHEALGAMAAQTQPDAICSALLAGAMDVIDASRLELFLRQQGEWHEAGHAEPAGDGLTVRCSSSPARVPADISRQLEAEAAACGAPGRPADPGRIIAVLGDEGPVVGVLRAELATPMDDEQACCVSMLASHAGLCLRRAWAHAALIDENERLRSASRDLALQSDLLRTFAENMPHRIYAKDREHRFIFGNTAVARGMGVQRADDLLGRTDFDFYPPEDARQYMQEEQAVMTSGGPMIDREEDVSYLLTGRRAWMLTTKVPLQDHDGRVIGIVGINYDITDRKQMEMELQRRNAELAELNERLSQAQAQLIQSEKLASIGQLAAGVAHEINNPVGYVLSNFRSLGEYVDGLLKLLDAYERLAHPALPPQVLREVDLLRERIDVDYLKTDAPSLIGETEEGLHRVRKIVQDLKDFSRLDDRQEWQWADLHRCIDATLNITKSVTKYSVDVVKEYGDLPPVQCLISQINQVLMNLLINAVHAVDASGHGRGTVSIRTGVDGEEAWIEISDSGCGIREEHLSRIFDPFFTTKPVGQGTGLGLSLAYGIVRKHGGRIDVRTRLGEGTSFRVTLPIRQAEAPVAPA